MWQAEGRDGRDGSDDEEVDETGRKTRMLCLPLQRLDCSERVRGMYVYVWLPAANVGEMGIGGRRCRSEVESDLGGVMGWWMMGCAKTLFCKRDLPESGRIQCKTRNNWPSSVALCMCEREERKSASNATFS